MQYLIQLKRMPYTLNRSIVHFLVLCFCFSGKLVAQPQEVRWLQNINPNNPSSNYWRATSSSVYPLAVAVPSSFLVVGFLNKDKNLQQKGWKMIGALAVNTVITQATKFATNRKRPYEQYPNLIYTNDVSETGHSFPSGHTSTAFNVAASISMQNKKWYVVLPVYAYASSVAYSRMYLGKHYPSDVFAGAVVGVGSAYLSNWLQKKIFK